MGLLNQLYTTYCAMEQKYVGNYAECAEPLVPISHQIINAELEITINAEGKFLSVCRKGRCRHHHSGYRRFSRTNR